MAFAAGWRMVAWHVRHLVYGHLMISIPDYEITQEIQAGPGFTRLTGWHSISAQPVVFHFFPLTHAILAGGPAVSKAYDPLTQIRSDHVIAVHAVEKIFEGPETGILLVMAPSEEMLLSEFIRQRDLPLLYRLEIAMQLATAVNDMHQADDIHKGMTLEAVTHNESFLSPRIADTVMKDYTHILEQDETAGVSALSAREREVLQLVAEGLSTRQIAERIHVSVKTVETHRQQIMKKLNAKSVAELTKIALREGLTALD